MLNTDLLSPTKVQARQYAEQYVEALLQIAKDEDLNEDFRLCALTQLGEALGFLPDGSAANIKELQEES